MPDGLARFVIRRHQRKGGARHMGVRTGETADNRARQGRFTGAHLSR